ncbi:hypothetical protein ACU4HD_44135 [Cupriavidus basilensis]
MAALTKPSNSMPSVPSTKAPACRIVMTYRSRAICEGFASRGLLYNLIATAKTTANAEMTTAGAVGPVLGEKAHHAHS